MTYIPHNKRCIELPSGFYFIHPYINKNREILTLELILDNNALINSEKWIKDITDINNFEKIKISPNDSPQDFGISPNIYLALVEQYLSNLQFKMDMENRINNFIIPFTELGIKFELTSCELSNLLKKNEQQNKADWMMTYLYILLLYRIYSAKKDDKKPYELLSQLKDKNVPCFSGIIMLCCLAFYLKNNQNINMLGDDKTAYSYLENFISIKSSTKGEQGLEEKYFRNRAGDLSLWLSIPKLIQNGYDSIGDLIVVTADSALKNFIFRCFPFVWLENGKMAVTFDEQNFEQEHVQKIKSIIEDVKWEFVPPENDDEKLLRLENLKNHVLDGSDDDLREEVEQIWNDWFLPGFGKSFQTVQA